MSYTTFADGQHRLYRGPDPAAAAEAARRALQAGEVATAVVFDDATGALTDVDPTAPAADVAARLARATPWAAPEPRGGPGRPKLGVVSREVSLLPRHWEWLAAQPGGASAALRRLVDEARKRDGGADAARQARDAIYKVLASLAGDAPGFEAATRALYAGRLAEARAAIGGPGWRPAVAAHVRELLDEAERLTSPTAPAGGPSPT